MLGWKTVPSVARGLLLTLKAGYIFISLPIMLAGSVCNAKLAIGKRRFGVHGTCGQNKPVEVVELGLEILIDLRV